MNQCSLELYRCLNASSTAVVQIDASWIVLDDDPDHPFWLEAFIPGKYTWSGLKLFTCRSILVHVAAADTVLSVYQLKPGATSAHAC
jgi:hypothetical protein